MLPKSIAVCQVLRLGNIHVHPADISGQICVALMWLLISHLNSGCSM